MGGGGMGGGGDGGGEDEGRRGWREMKSDFKA